MGELKPVQRNEVDLGLSWVREERRLGIGSREDRDRDEYDLMLTARKANFKFSTTISNSI